MKLTESQLRSIIREELQEMMTPEFGEDAQGSKIGEAIEIATSLQTHLAADKIGSQKLGQLVAILHEIDEQLV